MSELLRIACSNKAIFTTICILVGAFLGYCTGLIAYSLTLLIVPESTEKQLNVIIPGFTILGVLIGLYVPWANKRG
jgi:hypothetical protein